MRDLYMDKEAVEAAVEAYGDPLPTDGDRRCAMQAAIAAYLAALWKPIETAPRNRMVLIENSGLGAERVCIACRRDYAVSGFVDSKAIPIPTSWKPVRWTDIPALDAAAGGGDG